MKSAEFSFRAFDGTEIAAYKWLPEANVKAAVNIAHGMAEKAVRYERFAEALTKDGFAVYVQDLRGHGRTAGDVANVGYAGKDALNRMTQDLHHLSEIINQEFPAQPLFIFGHSMGSFLAQGYVEQWGSELKGALLSGAGGPADYLTMAGLIIAWVETRRLGRYGKSSLLNTLSLGNFNKQFEPARTKFDWLSRDPQEVDKYIADPYCGGIFTAGFFYDLFGYWRLIHRPERLAKIPQDLPLYVFSGSRDPMGENTEGVQKLINMLKQSGLKNINCRFYEGGRHEMLNETNRAEVINDIISWLNRHL